MTLTLLCVNGGLERVANRVELDLMENRINERRGGQSQALWKQIIAF